MVFWGVEVKPGKPFRQIAGSSGQFSRLHVSQAVLGNYAEADVDKRSIVKCKVGEEAPELFICSLRPGKEDAAGLDLIFEDDATFSVSGPTSVHLTGYYMPFEEEEEEEEEDDEDDEDDEDIILDGDEEDESLDEDEMLDESDDEDDSDEEIPNLVQPKSSVVISELDDGEVNGDLSRTIVKRSSTPGSADMHRSSKDEEEDEEDEDGSMKSRKRPAKKMPSAAPPEKKAAVSLNAKPAPSCAKAAKDATNEVDTNEHPGKTKKKKKKNKNKKAEEGGAMPGADGTPATENASGLKTKSDDQGMKKSNKQEKAMNEAKPGGDAKKQKKAEKTSSQEVAARESKADKPDESTVVRKFPNGLEVRELKMGKPDGKVAKAGKTVLVNYIGKLPNGRVFDSTAGKRPFAFRLGVGQVIKGWDIGVNGMRVGDKRQLKVPSALGYGAEGVKGAIPPNSTLVFDVELVDVRK